MSSASRRPGDGPLTGANRATHPSSWPDYSGAPHAVRGATARQVVPPGPSEGPTVVQLRVWHERRPVLDQVAVQASVGTALVTLFQLPRKPNPLVALTA